MRYINRYALSGFVVGIISCLLGLYVYTKMYPEAFVKVTTGPALIDIPEEDVKFFKSKFVTVKAGNKEGSGCEIKPDVYLTAFHTVINAWIDKHEIFVNNRIATVLAHSETENDFAILTTNPKEPKSSAKLENYDFKLGEDLIVVGSPGNQIALVEPAKIINEKVTNDDGQLKIFSKKISSLYIESGLSGGCVYPIGSKIPVGIVIKKDNDANHKVGEISLASKIID